MVTQADLAGSAETTYGLQVAYNFTNALVAANTSPGLAGAAMFAPVSYGRIQVGRLDTTVSRNPDNSEQYVPFQGVPGTDVGPLNIVVEFLAGTNQHSVFVNCALAMRLFFAEPYSLEDLIQARAAQGVLEQ